MRKREFRSDTMTLPDKKMRDAMVNAELGDDVCDEDPTVNRLQEMSAETLSTEAALFTPSGTAGNQIAIAVHTKPGDEVIVAETTHVIDHEAGAGSELWGVHMRAFTPNSTDWLTWEDIEPRIRTYDDVHIPDTGLVMLENPMAQGTVMPLEAMQEVRALTRRYGIPIHLDGARLFNAASALGVKASEIVDQVDSVMFCLSKSLGAPVGSILAGTSDFIRQAKRKRKILGGGMRQAGVLAAPGIIAITDGVDRIPVDHENAMLLGGLLAEIPGITLDKYKIQTNMVFFDVEKSEGRDSQKLVKYLNGRDFNVYPPYWWGIRIAICSRVTEEDVRALAAAIGEYMN